MYCNKQNFHTCSACNLLYNLLQINYWEDESTDTLNQEEYEVTFEEFCNDYREGTLYFKGMEKILF